MSFKEKVKAYLQQGVFFTHVIRHIFFTRKLYKLFIVLLPCIKIKQNRILCDHFCGSGYGDNPKYVSEKIHEKHLEYEIFFLYDKEKCDRKDFPEFIKLIPIFSFRHLLVLASAKFWIFDYRPFVHIPKRKNQFYIQTWHATIGTKKSEKDAEDTLPKAYVKNAIADSRQIDICIAGSKQMSDFYKKSFWYNGEVLESGYPRTDILFDAMKSAEIKKHLGFEHKKICMYVPTFRNNHSLEMYGLDFGRLKNILERTFSGEWLILFRLHPNMANVSVETLPVFVKNYSWYCDVQELLVMSDILITDYSSIVYDFMLTGRPAFIYATDFNDYEKERGFLIDLKETPFSIAENNSELCRNISEFNAHSYSKSIAAFKNKVGSLDDGHASERIIEWICKR